MKNILRCLSYLGILLLGASISRAALPSAITSSDARWIVYADFNAMRTSALGKEVIEIVQKAQFQATAGLIAVDLQKVLASIGSITVYGTSLSPDARALDGVMVVQGTAELSKIAEGLLVQATLSNPEHAADVKDLPFPAYAIMENASPNAQQLIIAFPPEPIILISNSKPQIIKARSVFRGEAASLEKVPASPLNQVLGGSANAYFFAATTMQAGKLFGDNGPQARIFQLAKSGLISMGEKDGSTFAHATLIATSEDMAVKLVKILEGMTAMLSLGESNDKQLTEFMNSVAVVKNKEAVTLDLSYPSARIFQMIKSLQSEVEQPKVSVQPVPPPRPAPQKQEAIVISEWKAEAPAAGGTKDGTPLAWHVIENVRLLKDTAISFTTQLNGAANAHLERVEISPAGAAGSPLIFRAEYMKLSGYIIESAPGDSGGKWITAQQPVSTAQLQFRGADGLYTMKIGYLADADGKASFSASTKDVPR